MKVKFIVLPLFILVGLGITACSTDITIPIIDNKKDECFNRGGVEFQSGFSGGYRHFVCVWRKS